MKKYNLSNIMKRAWELVKKTKMTISSALKKAWEEAKHTMIKFEKMAKVAIRNKGEINPNCGKEHDDESNYLVFRLWEKNGYRRIYANNYKKASVGTYLKGFPMLKDQTICDTNKKVTSSDSCGIKSLFMLLFKKHGMFFQFSNDWFCIHLAAVRNVCRKTCKNAKWNENPLFG